MSKTHLWINTALLVVALVFVSGLVGGNQSDLVGGSTSATWTAGNLVSNGTLTVAGATTLTGATTQTGAGSFSSTLDVTGDFTPGPITYSWVASTTLGTATASDFGKTIFLKDTDGGTLTLPAATDGVYMKFVIGAAFGTANVVIDSAEGDNIEGTLLVAGAVVDCDAEDQINFVNDGENLGDFFEISSDGTSWFIGASGALTAAKMTCTDPS